MSSHHSDHNESPFDDFDFSSAQKRRERAKQAKEEEEVDEQPLLEPVSFKKVRKYNVIRPTLNTSNTQSNRKSNFFGFGGDQPQEVPDEPESIIDTTPIAVGHRLVAVWPYDDYHLVQKCFYEKLDAGDEKTPETKKDIPVETNSSIPIFRRPNDPPDVSTHVQGLSLTAFEQVAEQRAIAIVSTWLFDAGLIDELLVHGGVGESVEVSATGRPVEPKMNHEISKLRNATKRQLALINARLNDGVAATGSEVQELVRAVELTKSDIGRLGELSSYVANTGDVEETSQFMLTKYPKLKQAINARRNLARCFRELDFFAQIPSTCSRLRDELHAGEWTAHEWSSLRSVTREHVELEIFLVEAERGMKQRLEETDEELKRMDQNNHFGRQAFRQSGMTNIAQNKALIDRFLEGHVQNVWELGDEIRLRIMSGIGAAFDLALNNPAGMVALVEAVEVYETANSDYKAVHGEESGKDENLTLRFTNMRAAALAELYKDFENRGLDVFRELTAQAADTAEEDEAANKQFSAVLRASNELSGEIGIVKNSMAQCFPPYWHITTVWTTCVAHICSTNILQQIGGQDGQRLPDLTVTQLLDLVAWVENFREIMEDTFPEISKMKATKTYFNQSPKLLAADGKSVDIEAAKDSLAWVNNTLWEVHDLAKDEFLLRTKEQTEGWLSNVYDADHSKTQTGDGRLVTSLCEDVYALAGVQLRTIRERLTRKSEALVQAVGVIFKNLFEKQTRSRDAFLVDFETCCAAANDFFRMSEKCEEIITEIQEESALSASAMETLEEQSAAILGLYSNDAVFAAKKTHVFCFDPIEEAIASELFGKEWEEELTHNELILTLVRTLDDFMEDLETFLDELMVQKAVEAQVTSSVNFYIKCMLKKAGEHNNNKKSWFTDNENAMHRMRGDLAVMREYFDGLADSMPTLERAIDNEFHLLETVLELIAAAAGLSDSDVEDFVLVLQKRVRNVGITKYVVGDLYHLVNPQEERKIYEVIDGMQDTMMAVAPTDEHAAAQSQDRSTVPGLRLDEMMAHHIATSKRSRPIKGNALEVAENALKGWRSNWT